MAEPNSWAGLPTVEVDLPYTKSVPEEGGKLKIWLRWEEAGLKPPPESKQVNAFQNTEVKKVHVTDLRPKLPDYSTMDSLETHGFMHQHHKTAMPLEDFYNNDRLLKSYYPETEELVKELTGASKVLVFDHVIRCKAKAGQMLEGGAAVQNPVGVCHNDYTSWSWPVRVRELAKPINKEISSTVVDLSEKINPEEAERLLETHRVSFINVWRSIGETPVRDTPIGFIDRQSFHPDDDFVPLQFVYPDRLGEIALAKYSPSHRWCFVSEMTPEEVILISCMDTKIGAGLSHSGHIGFSLPQSLVPPNTPARESIEMRTVAFWPKEEQGVPASKL